MNMIKVLWCRFQQCLGTFTMLLVGKSSKTGFLDIYLTTFSEYVISKIQHLWGSSFWSKCSTFKLDFKNPPKNSKTDFCFCDNCIWIGIVKLSLLTTGYFLWAANVLKSSPKIWHINNRHFFNSIDLAVLNECDKDAVMQILTVLGQVYHIACRRVLWNGTF